jgi:excisionase family DNA binding protein
MAEILNFGEAAQRAGVSRERLNKAIRSGRLPATRGGGPGKPTTIRLEDLQAWCLSEGLAMPVDAAERLERSQPPAIAEMMGRLDQMFAGMARLERLVEQVLERLERSQDPALARGLGQPVAEARTEPPTPTREQITVRIRHARDVEKKSYQQIAGELNAAGIPTFSGKGTWQKGNVERFYKGI